MSCSGYVKNKHGYEYCNHGFPATSYCWSDILIEGGNPFCIRENYVLPDNFDIDKYRKKMKKVKH